MGLSRPAMQFQPTNGMMLGRGCLRLAGEWNKVSTILPRVRMLAGENQGERVLSEEEEQRFLAAATELGDELEAAYRRALEGIRATLRGETPIRPDAYLLRDVTTILIDCGLRPEECYRLKWENIAMVLSKSLPANVELHGDAFQRPHECCRSSLCAGRSQPQNGSFPPQLRAVISRVSA